MWDRTVWARRLMKLVRPGCAVKAAVACGEVDEARYRQYVRFHRAFGRSPSD